MMTLTDGSGQAGSRSAMSTPDPGGYNGNSMTMGSMMSMSGMQGGSGGGSGGGGSTKKRSAKSSSRKAANLSGATKFLCLLLPNSTLFYFITVYNWI